MEIPRAWLPPLAGAVVVLLLLVAYLLGKEAGRRAGEAAPVEPPAASAPAGEVESTPSTPATPPGPGTPVERPGVAYQPPTPLNPSLDDGVRDAENAGTTTPTIATPAVNPRSAAVAAYFTEIEGYERQAQYWSNPQELAMSLVSQGAQGDTSGLQKLLDAQRTAQGQIESMTVPSECREHHGRTLDLLRRAGELLQELERGMASGNLEGLLSLTGQARQLESETREVDVLAKQLKARYGVPGS